MNRIISRNLYGRCAAAATKCKLAQVDPIAANYISSISNRQQKRQFSINETSWSAKGLSKEADVAKKSENSLEFFASVPEFKNTDKYPESVRKLALEVMSLNVVECHQLMNLIQTKLGISDDALFSSFAAQFGLGGGSGAAVAPVGGGAAPAAGGVAAAPADAKPAEEKTAFNLKLTAVDATSKIKIIKEVRTITGLGLKEAKDLVEKAPTMLKEGLKKEEAESFKKLLESVGAKVELL